MFASLLEFLRLKGATDGTSIGNTGDRLKVDAQITSSAGGILSWDTDVRYEDLNTSVGGIARGTSVGSSFTDVYNQTGSGYLTGFLITLESAFDKWEIRLTVDSNVIFTINTDDIENANIYGFDKGGDDDLRTVLGFSIHSNTLRWTPPLKNPVSYATSIQLEIRYVKGGSKKFRAGLLARTV